MKHRTTSLTRIFPLPAGGLRGVRAVLFLLLILAQASFAQLSDPLSGTLGPGELHVVDEISVEYDDSLILLPGTTFLFDGPFEFDIAGTLVAEGLENDSIFSQRIH